VGTPDPVPPEVERAAAAGAAALLQAIPREDLRHYGFASPEELDRAQPEPPLRVYQIRPDKLLAFGTNAPLATLADATQTWYFPLEVDGEVRVLLTVDAGRRPAQAVAVGSAGLAAAIGAIRKAWPARAGYSHQVVVCNQVQADFVAVSKNGRAWLAPLPAGAATLGLEPLDENTPVFHEFAEIAPALLQAVQEWALQADDAAW
jgi:hypothetical protein